MHTIDLNCDMGEGLNNDALLMPYISSANIACGYHAGDESIMKRTVELALLHNVAIGAHPGFKDKANFGRTERQLPLEEVHDLVIAQLSVLQKITESLGATIHHVKPHGALYNMSAKDPLLATTIAKAVYAFDKGLLLFGLSGSHAITEAKKEGLITVSEVFADRTYQDDSSLTPRSNENALIENTEESLHQVLQMIQKKTVRSVNGKQVPIIAESICIHGDGSHAVDFAKHIYHTLKQHHVGIQAV